MTREITETPTRSRRPLWIGLSLTAVAVMAFAGAAASAHDHSGFGRWHRGMDHDQDPESVRRHLDFISSWVLEELEATDEQKAAIRPLALEAADQLLVLAADHRRNRQAFHDALTAPEVDRAALEELRLAGLELADRASRILVDTIADIAAELTHEQRLALAEKARHS